MRPNVSTSQLAATLTLRDDAALTGLLRMRPDLAAPAPSSLTSLAARAGSRHSVDRALASLDGAELAVAEAIVALAPLEVPTMAELTAAVGLDAAAAARRLEELALTVDGAPVAALAEALGPYPAGLGPTLAELDAAEPPTGGAPTTATPTTPAALSAALAEAPASAVGTLDALTWGPPVGTITAKALPEGAQWLLDHAILYRLSPTQLVLPREVALAARDGRTHREPPRPPEPVYRTVPAGVVDAEGARTAEEIVRLVSLLLETWRSDGARTLRTGGVGVRELRRAASTLDLPEHQAAFVIELAAMAELLAQEGDEQIAWVPARTTEDWLADSLPLRWARLVLAWHESARAPWLVGTREDGSLRAVLEPTLERGWAVELRRRVLDVLDELPDGAAPDAGDVHAVLAWMRPRSSAPESTVAAVLEEAALLGLTGAGALTRGGRALRVGAGEDDIAAALEATLPTPVGEILVQGDLTAVVPGRPMPELGSLLAHCSDVESRGSGLTVRFTPGSVRRAMDAGIEADHLLNALARYSRTPLPQALEYLVRDAARRHGQVRVGAATSYLRVEDPALGAELVANPMLRSLRLRELVPTVIVSDAPPDEVLRTLRQAGLGPVAEGSGGAVAVPVRRRLAGAPIHPGAAVSTYTRHPDVEDLGRAVARMRAGEAQVRRDVERRSEDGPIATDPVHALELLRTSAAAGDEVEIVIVGAFGKPEHRRVRPLSVDGGRVRVADLDRETELTVAIHRITSVATPSTA